MIRQIDISTGREFYFQISREEERQNSVDDKYLRALIVHKLNLLTEEVFKFYKLE